MSFLGQQGRAGQLPGHGSQEHPCAEVWGQVQGFEAVAENIDFTTDEQHFLSTAAKHDLRPEKRHCGGKADCLLQ